MDASGLTPLLIDAKREYVGQLTDVLAPYVIGHINSMYAAAQSQRRAATLAFQTALRDIQQWNATAIAHQASHIQSKYSFLGDLIAAVFVAYVKILSSVKLHNQKPNIRLKLPSNDTFVHRVFVHAAREFYGEPGLVGADRARKLAIVRAAVEASVRDMMPIEDILKAYLGNTVDDNAVNPADFGTDDDDDERPASPVLTAEPARSVAAEPFAPPPRPMPSFPSFQPAAVQDPAVAPQYQQDDEPKQISTAPLAFQLPPEDVPLGPPPPPGPSPALFPLGPSPAPSPQPPPAYPQPPQRRPPGEFFSDAEDDF